MEPMNNNINVPQPGAEQAQPEQEPAAQQGQKQYTDDDVKELTKKALGMVYGEGQKDSKGFGALIEMLKSGKSDLPEVVSDAAVAIGKKLEMEVGELPDDVLGAVGQAIVLQLLDLSQTAGLIDGPDQKIAEEAYGKTIMKWMKQNPNRIDPEKLKANAAQIPEMAGQAGGQGMAAPAPAAPQQVAQAPAQASPAPAQGAPAGSEEGLMTGAR